MRDGRTGRWASAPSRSPSSSPGHSSFAGPVAPAPQPVGGGDGGGAAGICLAYSVEELANRDFAFEGTVTAIEGDQATFAINESFIGDMSGSVTLTAPVLSEDISFEGGTELVQGDRYSCRVTTASSGVAASRSRTARPSPWSGPRPDRPTLQA